MGALGRLGNYAAAIVDFDLGPMNVEEIAEYLPAFFGSMPMVLISGRDRRRTQGMQPWPTSIKAFVHKEQGPDAILDAGLALAQPWRSETEAQAVTARAMPG